MYDYMTVDPRESGVRIAGRRDVLGVEVTVPRLAAMCGLGNIDPQHSGGDAATAAIEAAVTWPLPPPGTTLATVRPDADSIGAMAVLELRALDVGGDLLTADVGRRVRLIADADTEATGPWPGPRNAGEPAGLLRTTSIVEAVAMDHGLSLADRVDAVADWLRTGYENRSVRGLLLAEAADAMESTSVRLVGDQVVVVVGTHRLAMSIGYRHGPVVVATNPAFSWQGGPPHRKHTVARWNSGVRMDWDGMLADLRAADPGWGGSASIVGSPQGEVSRLTSQEVVEVVSRRMPLAEPPYCPQCGAYEGPEMGQLVAGSHHLYRCVRGHEWSPASA